MQTDSYTLFHEHQSLIRSHFFVQIIIIICFLGGWWGFVQQIIFGIPFGTNPASDIEMIIIWIMVGWFIPILMGVIGLDIEVTQKELRFRYKPFHFSDQVILCSSILQADADTYRSWYGWGIKYKKGIVSYTVSGNEGVYITYQTPDGKEKTILLGSKNAGELERVLFKTARKW